MPKFSGLRSLLATGVVIASFALGGCNRPTKFTGEAKVPGRQQGCETVCQRLGMELAGMVVMGEFSNGCICAVAPRADNRAGSDDKLVLVGASGAVAAVAGVQSRQSSDSEASQDRK